jgi:hypothetical protein
MTDELEIIFEAKNEVQALLYRAMLQEAGIDVMERPMEPEVMEGVRWRDLHSQLLVRAEDEARALELIDAFASEAASGELATEAAAAAAEAEKPSA